MKLKVGLIQQKNTGNIADNIERLKAGICSCAKDGAELIVLQELHNGLYFCQTEDTTLFDLAETIPGPSTEIFGALAKELGVVIVLSLFEKELLVYIIILQLFWNATAALLVNTEKCIFQMILLITRNSILHQVI